MEEPKMSKIARAAIAFAACGTVLLAAHPRAAGAPIGVGLLPPVGRSQSFLVVEKFGGPRSMPGQGAQEGRSSSLTITRTSEKSVDIAVRSDNVAVEQNVAVDARGALGRVEMPNPSVVAYGNALALGAGAAANHRVGGQWSVTFAFPGPPGAAGGFIHRDVYYGGPADENGRPPARGFAVGFMQPSSVTLHVSVASIAGSTIKLIASGSTSNTMRDPNGEARVDVVLAAEETIDAGRLTAYSESMTNTVNGPPGQMKITSTTTLTSK